MNSTFEVDVTGISGDSESTWKNYYSDSTLTASPWNSASTLSASEKNTYQSENLRQRKRKRLGTIHDYKYKEARRQKRLAEVVTKQQECTSQIASQNFYYVQGPSSPKGHNLCATPPHASRNISSTEAYGYDTMEEPSSTEAYSDSNNALHHFHSTAVQTELHVADADTINLQGSRITRTRRQVHQPNSRQYLQNCLQEITAPGFLDNLLTVLDHHNLLPHFMSLVKSLENRELKPDNIAVLLCLERAFLHSKPSSTDMRYSDKSKQFWELIYRLGGGEMIRLLSGPKHFNMLNTQEVNKNKYSISLGDFNFAVPNEKILAHSVFQLPKEIYPGVIEQCLQFTCPENQYFLSVDAKKCIQGLKLGLDNYGYGDIDLLGQEDPSMQQRKDQLDSDLEQLDLITAITMDDTANVLAQVRNLAKAVNIISKSIRNCREGIVRHEILRRTFQTNIDKGKEKPSRYTYAFSNIDAFKIAAKENIQHLLSCNQEICRIMANLNETTHFFPTSNEIDLTKQVNCNFLLPPEQIRDDNFLTRNPEFIKQRTEKWFQVRSKCHVTASTMYNALGLGKTSDKMQHFKHRVLGKAAKPVTPAAQAAMDHGSRHEVRVKLTVCNCSLHFSCSY